MGPDAPEVPGAASGASEERRQDRGYFLEKGRK